MSAAHVLRDAEIYRYVMVLRGTGARLERFDYAPIAVHSNQSIWLSIDEIACGKGRGPTSRTRGTRQREDDEI